MNDLISREAAIECLEMFLDKQCDRERTKARGFSDNDIWAAVNMGYEALSAEKVGKWIIHPEIKNIYGGTYIECSECREKYVVQYIEDEKFCRNCGADMRGEEDERHH